MPIPSGSIPEKIEYYFYGAKKIIKGADWKFSLLKKNQITAVPAYAADPTDYRSVTIAKRSIAYRTSLLAKTPASSVKVDNVPIKNVKIVSLARNFSGNATFKVLIDNYLFDLKEDVMIDSILDQGINPGGIINGEFIWAKVGAQIKLVRIGSELHKVILEFSEKKSLPCVKKKHLEVGGIYQTSKKDYAVYLGLVNTTGFSINPNKKFKFNNKLFKKSMLFYTLFSSENPAEVIHPSVLERDTYRFSIKSSHKFIEKLDTVKVPKNVISIVRDIFTKKAKANILEYAKSKNPTGKYTMMNDNYLEYCITNYSKFFNMYSMNESPTKLFDVTKYLVLS